MRDHIKILGILNIIMGSLTALVGVVVLVVMGSVASFMALGVPDSSPSDAENARAVAPFLGLIGLVVAIFLTAVAVPSIIGGWGLLKYKSLVARSDDRRFRPESAAYPLWNRAGSLWPLGSHQRSVAPAFGKWRHDASSGFCDAAATRELPASGRLDPQSGELRERYRLTSRRSGVRSRYFVGSGGSSPKPAGRLHESQTELHVRT
jgi:hypothetical protein